MGTKKDGNRISRIAEQLLSSDREGFTRNFERSPKSLLAALLRWPHRERLGEPFSGWAISESGNNPPFMKIALNCLKLLNEKSFSTSFRHSASTFTLVLRTTSHNNRTSTYWYPVNSLNHKIAKFASEKLLAFPPHFAYPSPQSRSATLIANKSFIHKKCISWSFPQKFYLCLSSTSNVNSDARAASRIRI